MFSSFLCQPAKKGKIGKSAGFYIVQISCFFMSIPLFRRVGKPESSLKKIEDFRRHVIKPRAWMMLESTSAFPLSGPFRRDILRMCQESSDSVDIK